MPDSCGAPTTPNAHWPEKKQGEQLGKQKEQQGNDAPCPTETWQPRVSRSTGRDYYHNHTTGESSYDKPAALLKQELISKEDCPNSRSTSPSRVNASRTAGPMQAPMELPDSDLNDLDKETTRITLSPAKSRVLELEAQLSAAAQRSSQELQEHVKLVSALQGQLQEHSLLNSPLSQARDRMFELESRLEGHADPDTLLGQAHQRVLELEQRLQQRDRSAAEDRKMLAEAQRAVLELSESAAKDKSLRTDAQLRLQQSENEARLREAASKIKLKNDRRQAAIAERHLASSTLASVSLSDGARRRRVGGDGDIEMNDHSSEPNYELVPPDEDDRQSNRSCCGWM